MALGLAINIKYQALGLVLYLIFRKRWKALAANMGGRLFGHFCQSDFRAGFAKDAELPGAGIFQGCCVWWGLRLGDTVANIEPLTQGSASTSITSAAARFVEQHGMRVSPFVLAGAVAVMWLLLMALIYRRHKMPVLAWPVALQLGVRPWVVLVGVEWMAVIGSVLAFSPETNSRHLVQTAARLINVLGVVRW